MLDRKHARNRRAAVSIPRYINSPSDHTGPVPHDVHAHAPGVRPVFRNTSSIIHDLQLTRVIFSREPDGDVLRASMLYGVVYGLLRDVMEMR